MKESTLQGVSLRFREVRACSWVRNWMRGDTYVLMDNAAIYLAILLHSRCCTKVLIFPKLPCWQVPVDVSNAVASLCRMIISRFVNCRCGTLEQSPPGFLFRRWEKRRLNVFWVHENAPILGTWKVAGSTNGHFTKRFLNLVKHIVALTYLVMESLILLLIR